MNINASNPSLQNIITKTLMGKKEKRPTFEEVYKTLSKISARMNTKLPLDSALTNEQMFRCYVQNTMPKLQKSNDTFGESELNTVLMRLLGNDPSGNALTPTPLVTPPTATPPTATLATPTAASIVAPIPPPAPPPTPTPTPTPPTGVQTATPTPTPTGAPAPAPTTSLTPLTIPVPGATPAAAPSPVVVAAQSLGGSLGGALLNMASVFYSPTQPIAGSPTAQPPPPPPVLPATNLGAAFTSVATIPPNSIDLARQFVVTQVLTDFDKPGLQQVINIKGKPLKPTKDPLEMEISAGNQLLNKIRTRKIDPNDLTGDLKINYDRALELKRQVAATKVATKARKEAASATKKRERSQKRFIIIASSNSSGITQSRNKSAKAIKTKSRKSSSKSGSKFSKFSKFSKCSRSYLIIINCIHIIIHNCNFYYLSYIIERKRYTYGNIRSFQEFSV